MIDHQATPATPTPAFTPLLTTEEAAKVLGISKSSLAHRRSAGLPSPPFLRIGGSVRYRLQDIHTWVDEQITAQQTAA